VPWRNASCHRAAHSAVRGTARLAHADNSRCLCSRLRLLFLLQSQQFVVQALVDFLEARTDRKTRGERREQGTRGESG
jgi:hypothetical protein